MKRRVSQRREEIAERQLALAALAQLGREWMPRRRSKRRRPVGRLARLAAETRELLALWSYYRLASLEAMETGPLGAA